MDPALENVRKAFDKAVGPFRKRQEIMRELKEPDVAKVRRAELVKEAEQLDEQWVQAMQEVQRQMAACERFQQNSS
jgi:histidinol dehydrogenase